MLAPQLQLFVLHAQNIIGHLSAWLSDSPLYHKILMQAGALAQLRRDPGEAHADTAPSAPEDTAYDRARLAMLASARGAAADRQLTREELQELEDARLAKLAADAKARQRAAPAADVSAEEGTGAAEGEDVDTGAELPAGGYARRRALARQAEARSCTVFHDCWCCCCCPYTL